jgi:hypothetical protein
MAKKKKEEVEQTTNEPKGDVTKVKAKMKKPAEVIEDTITKVDLSNPPKTEENEQPVDNTETEDVQEKIVEETTDKKEDVEQPTEENVEQPVLEEIENKSEAETEPEVTQEQLGEVIAEAEAAGKEIPENIQKLMNFMEETGGDLNDYVKLNQDYSELENQDLLYEYYKQTKPHLNNEEINFLMEDQFSFDEDVDEERDIKRKKLALKEQVANAKTHLEENKSKYYEDIKAGSKLTQEQQKAVDFFNRYNKETEESTKATKHSRDIFTKKTNEVFSDKFKGFEYNVGDKKFRFNVKNANEVKDIQSDINNTVKKFLNDNNEIEDATGYHKSIFSGMNADAIANHFYEQGKADALKDSIAKAKNVDMNPRQAHGEVEAGGIKVKVLGDSSSDFKFKIKQK